jgi:homeobox protein cut-like
MSGNVDQDALLLASLQAASQSWLSFDWSGKRAQWDSTLTQVKDARELSVTARKQLADTTKQFKKSVKNVEQASTALASSASPDIVASTVKTIDGLAKECRHTVKSYQEEIDNLTRRCKASENAFSSVAQALAEVPDPSAVFATAFERLQSQQSQMTQLLRAMDKANKEMANMESNFAQRAERYEKEIAHLKESNKTTNKATTESGLGKEEREELLQLRREVAEYEVEFRSLKNQDITIRKLEARIVELQKAGEEELHEKIEKAKQELAETEGRRAAEALEREAAMERRVQTLELQLKAERAGREATQAHLLEADEGAGEREAAWEAQRRILVDDAERLRETLHEATRERDELRLRVGALEGGSSASRSAPPSGGIGLNDIMLERKAYEAEVSSWEKPVNMFRQPLNSTCFPFYSTVQVSELSHTANALREELRLKDEAITEERQTLHSMIEALKRERAELNSTVASLESQLAAAPSQSLLESMKRELRILKRLEYNADDIDADRDPEMTGGNEDEEKNLESVLVAKLRRTESELVRERNLKMDNSKTVDQLKRELAASEKAKAELEKLVASLEADLEKAIVAPLTPSKSRKIVEPIAASENPATLQSILDPNAPMTPLPPFADNSASKVSLSAVEKAEDDHSVATIVMAQRDRLRARCEALEAERDSFKRELQIQVQAAESLKADNTKLYEKVRYLQNYSTTQAGGGGGSLYNRHKTLNDRDLDLEALEQRYEASVDPFRQFSRAERQRKLNEMSPMERIVFVVAKTVLGSKGMRTGLFFYVLAMHLLVFVTTYHWSHQEGCGQHNMMDKEQLSHLPPDHQQAAAVAQAAVAQTIASN